MFTCDIVSIVILICSVLATAWIVFDGISSFIETSEEKEDNKDNII